MKPTRNDTRTLLKESGCAALFLKEIIAKGRKVSCFAFRTGTNNVSSIVSTQLEGHQWEAICLNQKHTIAWESDKKNGLDHLLFKPLATHADLFCQFKVERESLFDVLKDEHVDVLTLEQGTADWHKGRQFSLTSSQADGSFRKALIVYQDDENWCKVAEYLQGEDYYTGKFNFYFKI
jgi:hypothetical protein